MVYQEGFDPSELARIKDSLTLSSAGTIGEIPRRNLDMIYLLGQDYTLVELLSLPNTPIQWLPFYKENQITNISWDVVLSNGQWQSIKGSIHVALGGTVQLFEFGELKQEVEIVLGGGEFTFKFPAIVLGQNEMAQNIDGEEVGVIRFFVNTDAPVNYQLLFGFQILRKGY